MKYSKLGYKRYSPDLYNKYNVIPSGRITMQDVDFPVFGMDDMGNTQMMYPGGEYQFPGNQVFEIPVFQNGSETFDESIREQLVASANRIIDSKDFYRLSPEKAAVVKENKGNPNELTCIGGVCRILKEADLIPQVIESNTDFVQQAESLGFSKPGFDLTKLRPGDVIQHFGSSNQSGKGYPTHAQMYIGQDEDGNYKFFDNYRGTSQWYGKKGYKSYSEQDLKKFLELGKAGKSKGAQLIYLNPNAEIDYRTQEELQAIQSKKDSRARRLPVETFKDEMYSGPDYFSEIVDTQDLPYAYMPSEGANKNEKDLIGLFNSQEFDRTLRKTFSVSDQTLETLKPIIYGIMKQESNFGNPETLGRVAKYKLENLFSPSGLSTGPAAVRYKDLRDPAKSLLGNSSRSLNTMKGAYIGALDSLLTAGSISDAYQINNPELADKDPWTAALYFYNGQGRSLRRGENIEGDALRMDPGSYPSKVFENTKDLRRFVPFDSDVSDPDVYRYPYDVQVTPKEEEVAAKKQGGGQTSLSLGYDSMYGSPAAAFRYMMNPQDDSKYYGEVFGTKQGPGVAVGLDYDNQKYGTQGMIRLGLDPLRGASIRAQGGKRFNPIDNRREELSWGPYGGVNWQTNDYRRFTGAGNDLAINNVRPRLTAGLNAQYEKELDNRGRLSIEGDLGVGIGDKYGDMGQFKSEPYGAIKATYSFPRYKNTRTERPQPTTYSSGYKQGGGEQLQMRKGNAFDDYIVNPTIYAIASAADYLGPIVNQALDDVSSAAMNAMYTSPTLAPLAIKAQGAARPWLFQNIRPVEYPGIVSGAVNLTKGVLGLNAPPSRDPDGRYSIGEEAWQRALGNPTQSHYIIPSKYKPSKAKDADAQYYTLNRDVIDPQLLIAEAKKRNIQEGQSIVLPSLAPYIREGFMPREEFSQIDPLQNFTIGRGKDEKGNYISIYDRYDFEGPLNTLTNPYEFYDRYYYKGGGQHGGLDRWFAEKWVDVKTGKECGRQSGEKRKGYPACRPSKRVNSKTPKTASELSSTEKAKFKREKTSSQRISYQHKRSEYGGSIPRFRSDLY